MVVPIELSQPKCTCKSNTLVKPHSKTDQESSVYGNPKRLVCTHCIKKSLEPILQKQRAAIQNRDNKQQWCAQRLLQLRQLNQFQELDVKQMDNIDQLNRTKDQMKTPSQLKHEHDTLHRKLAKSHHETQNLSIQLTSLQISNDSRESTLIHSRSQTLRAENSIQTIYQNCTVNELKNTLAYQHGRIHKLRIQLVLRLFVMHKLQIGEEIEKMMAESDQDSNINDDTRKNKQKNPKGYGKIAGLPLPHAGPIYYALFPPIILTSALRLVAILTCSIARCLKIDLPHPIILRPGVYKQFDIIEQDYSEKNTDLLEADCDDFSQIKGRRETSTNGSDGSEMQKEVTKDGITEESASSYRQFIRNPATSTAATLLNRFIPPRVSSIRRTLIRPQPNYLMDAENTPISLGPSSVSSNTTDNDEVLISFVDESCASKSSQQHFILSNQYISHATHAVIRENRNNNNEKVTKYALIYQSHEKSRVKSRQTQRNQTSASDGSNTMDVSQKTVDSSNHHHHSEDHFSIGLQLLQNNVVALCIRAGVPVSKMWPAEAMLLNLHSLRVYFQDQIKTEAPKVNSV